MKQKELPTKKFHFHRAEILSAAFSLSNAPPKKILFPYEQGRKIFGGPESLGFQIHSCSPTKRFYSHHRTEGKSFMELQNWIWNLKISILSLELYKEFIFLSVHGRELLSGGSGRELKYSGFTSLPKSHKGFQHSSVPCACNISCGLPNLLSGEACREDCKCNHMTVGHLAPVHECKQFATGSKCRHSTAGWGQGGSMTFYNRCKYFMIHKTSFWSCCNF